MHETTITYDRRRVAAGVTLVLALLAAMATLAVGMLLAHQPQSGITPAPVPAPAPVAPVEPAPAGPPVVLIPDNA